MSKRFAQVIILIEDKQQQSFVSRLLQELGYPVHKLKILPIPAGEGSGEAYVREQYPIQVKAMRPRAQYQDVGLVVAIDGDGRTVAERQQQLADQLVAATLDARTAPEKIVHLVPCRSIETWIDYLGDITKAIDETKKYPKLKGRERECKKAVEEMARLCKSYQPLPASWRAGELSVVPRRGDSGIEAPWLKRFRSCKDKVLSVFTRPSDLTQRN